MSQGSRDIILDRFHLFQVVEVEVEKLTKACEAVEAVVENAESAEAAFKKLPPPTCGQILLGGRGQFLKVTRYPPKSKNKRNLCNFSLLPHPQFLNTTYCSSN